MKKIIVDCDPGVDDLMAIQFLLNREDVEILAITTVAGNCRPNQGAENILKYKLKKIQLFLSIYLDYYS